MYSRPKPEETDEDLLAQQTEFMTKLKENKIQLAAKIVPLKREGTNTEEPVGTNTNDIDIDVEKQLANTFESIPSNINIGRIVEKRKLEHNETVTVNIDQRECGFPKARRRDMKVSGRSGSIFSQQLKKNKNLNEKREIVAIPMDIDVDSKKSSFHISNIVNESKILTVIEKEEIHEENLKLLNTTPESEILEEKERLLSTMDPAIVSFLRARRQQQKSTSLTIHQQNQAGENVRVENIKATSEILENPSVEKWMNFDTLETHKLAWMKDIESVRINKDEALNARFDFNGWLMPSENLEINEKNRILFHHGEEPDRPGYTLQELFTLARSSVAQQKIIALNSIANILSLSSSGVYQDIIEIPIEQLFFLLRFCMDDNAPGVLNASVKAMRCLICNHVDEICLDCLLGFGWEFNLPILPVDQDEEDDNTVNDQQLAERNIVRCLVRSGIYTRIRYIINTIKPAVETIVCCIEILIRLAEDSEFVLREMVNSENLIASILENFLPKKIVWSNHESAYGTPIVQVVKLIRIICCHGENFAKSFIEKYRVIDSISNYLQDETFRLNANGMKLQIECFHLWRIFLEYNLSFEYVSTLTSILLQHLDYHIKHTNTNADVTYVREGHCAAILILLGKLLAVKPSIINQFENLIKDSVKKWIMQFSQNENFECGKSQIVSSVFFLSTAVYGYSKLTEIIDDCCLILLKSGGFSDCTKNIENSSMLLNNYEPVACSANLKTLQTSAWYAADHVIPIIQTSSCLPFLSTLSTFIEKSSKYQVKLNFLLHPNVKKYVELLEKRKTHFLTGNWFTRIESRLLMNILVASVDVQKDLDTSIFYSLAVKALCVFHVDQMTRVEYILEKIIFCPSFYPSEILLRNLNLNEKKNLEISLSNLGEIREVYSEVLGLKKPKDNAKGRSLCTDISIGNVIPIDWTYTPILLLYSTQQEKSGRSLSEEKQIFLVKNCLRWILIYETYFPSLVAAVNPTDRFCRLACVFLGSDGLFLNEEIHNLLELCLKNLLNKYESDLNFDKEIEGLKNFQDFYNQMLEQYQGVSYGDYLFSNFVLVPLSQKQNVQWRKTLWSEYMGAVQIMSLPAEKLLSNMETYLNPPEEDESLLKCYKIALSKNFIRKTSVLYSISTHHYKEFLKKKNSAI